MKIFKLRGQVLAIFESLDHLLSLSKPVRILVCPATTLQQEVSQHGIDSLSVLIQVLSLYALVMYWPVQQPVFSLQLVRFSDSSLFFVSCKFYIEDSETALSSYQVALAGSVLLHFTNMLSNRLMRKFEDVSAR